MTRDLEKDTAAAGYGGPADGRPQAAGGAPVRKSVNTKALLAVLFGTAFIASFNENIVNVALVDIMAEFSVDTVTAQWMVTGYMMVSAVITAVIAFLMRRLTLRQSFFAGGIILALGSAIDFVAPNFAVLLGARLFQAVGTGIFVPIMMNTVLMIAPRKKLGTYLSIGSCCITFGPASGPVVSGLIVTYFGWRAMFLPTFVAVVVLMIAGLAFVKPLVPTQKVKLDVLSVLLAAAGLISFIFGLLLISSNPLQAVVLVAVAVAVIAVFARRQGRLETPLLNLEPLRASGFSLACILVIFAMMTTFSMSVLLPLYFEGAGGLTAFATGFLVLIPILVNAGAALVGGRVMDSRGEWPLLPAGFLLVAAGMVAVSLIAGSLQIGLVVAAACVVYAGVGLVMSPSQTAGLKQIPHRLNADGVSLISLLIMVAASVGPSLYMGILSASQSSALAAGASAAQASADGFAAATVVAAGIGIAGTVLAFFYSRKVAGTEPVAAQETKAETAQMGLFLPAVMKRDVFTVRSDQPVYAAVQQMLEHKTSGLPVVDERDRVVGFVSDGDIMKTLADQGQPMIDLMYSLSVFANDEHFDKRLDHLMNANVMEVATSHVVSVDAETPIERVCAVLGERRIKKLPVLEDGRLVGTVSRSDVNRSLMSAFLRKTPEEAARS